MSSVLGLARGASLVAAVQLIHSAQTDLDRNFHELGVLDVAAAGRISANDGADHAGDQPAIPVLDPHRAGAVARAAGMADEHSVPSSGSPWLESAIHRPQSRRNTDH